MVLGPLVGWVIVRNRPPWGDEAHFLYAVRLFGEGISLEFLRTYPELSTPLTYMLYAAWGGIVGFETSALRLLSPLIASLTILTWLTFLTDVLRSRMVILVALATVVLNPYFLGLSVFVFTDMLALLGLALTALGVSRRHPWLAAAGLATATCTRQYLAFVAVALVGLAVSGRRNLKPAPWLLAVAAGMLPLAGLVLLWGGHLAPDSWLRGVYMSGGLRFDPHAWSLYVSVPAVYLIPLVGLVLWRRPWRSAHLVAAGAVGLVVLAFPVEASIVQIRQDAFVVGFLHRLIDTFADGAVESALFAAFAVVNVWALGLAFSWFLRAANDHRVIDADLFAWLGIGAFLVVMPFSYMPWEKYALPLLMLQSVVLARSVDRRTSGDAQS